VVTGRGRYHKYLMELDLRQGIEREVYFLGRHYAREIQLLIDSILKPGDTFIDVGANIGFVSLHAARHVGPEGCVIAFEPQETCYVRMMRTVEMNQISQIEVHHLGLAEQPGTLQLKIMKANTLSSFAIDEGHDGPNVIDKVDVPVARGDDVVRDRVLGDLMLKVDVEGFELHVLRGFVETIERHKPPILIEIVPLFLRRAGVDEYQLFDFFHRQGYRGFDISLTGRWNYRTLRLRPVVNPEDLYGTADPLSAPARDLLLLPASSSRFDPAPYLPRPGESAATLLGPVVDRSPASCRIMKTPPGSANLTRAVFLDRDGVLNRAIVRDGRPYPPQTLEGFEILPGVAEAVRRLHDAGFLLIGATNQPDVARGTQRREVVETMNARLQSEMPLVDILVCYEDGEDCPRRKPNPGLLLEAAETHRIDLPASFMVGDRWRDVEAGRRAGCRTVFLDRGYAERRPDPPADHTAADLTAAADWILSQTQNGG
jgi:D-glycero-D-manno-heptose 1,7-bisphosphate phosphatase